MWDSVITCLGSTAVRTMSRPGALKCWGVAPLGYGNANNIGDNELPSAVGTISVGSGLTAVSVTVNFTTVCALLSNGRR